MTKNEILEAINSVIVSNDQKGITAEVLANILTEIVNAIPEGGSGGAGGEYIDMTFADPESESMELTPEAMAHNAELYEKMIAALSGQGAALPSVSLNYSEEFSIGMYSSAVMNKGGLFFTFHMPMADLMNVAVSGTNLNDQSTQSVLVGSGLCLVVVTLNEDGSVVLDIPGW